MTMDPIEKLKDEMEKGFQRLLREKGWGGKPVISGSSGTPTGRKDDETLAREMGVLRAMDQVIANARHSREEMVLQNLRIFGAKLAEEPYREDVRDDLTKALQSFPLAHEESGIALKTPTIENEMDSTPERFFPEESQAIRKAADDLQRLTSKSLTNFEAAQIEKSANAIVAAWESMRKELDTRRVDVNNLVRTVAEQHRPALKETGISLDLDISPLPCHILADPGRLTDAIGELIRNAAKHAFGEEEILKEKEITVRVRKKRKEERHLTLVEVSDNGQGLSADLQEEIWEDGVSGNEGTGQGLAMVRRVAKIHGGDATSEPGERSGSKFSVSLRK